MLPGGLPVNVDRKIEDHLQIGPKTSGISLISYEPCSVEVILNESFGEYLRFLPIQTRSKFNSRGQAS